MWLSRAITPAAASLITAAVASATLRHFQDNGQTAEEQLTASNGFFRIPVSSLLSVMRFASH